MMSEPIAKGPPNIISLKKHSLEVLTCATAMLDALEPYLPSTNPPFRRQVRQAAIYHDLGKAANGMQKALQTGKRWGFRHEVLTAAMLIASGLASESPLALAAVLAHHKSLNDEKLVDCIGANVGSDDEDEFLLQWRNRTAELQAHWDWVREFIRRSDTQSGEQMAARLPALPDELPDVRAFFRQLEELLGSKNTTGLSEQCKRYLAARGLLMAADHLASSGLTAPKSELSHQTLDLRNFQQRLAGVRSSAILEAPTGAGKTRAAIEWALANRVKGERIFYVLPFQASINAMEVTLAGEEGFGFGEENVGVIHHSALLREFKRHYDTDSDNYQEAAEAAKERLDQTRQFYRPIKIVTPFQILRLLFGCKRFEIGLSEMLGGLVVFDEIHAYEPHIAALIDVMLPCLERLDVRYLFMTATFPKFLRERISQNLSRVEHVYLTDSNAWERDILRRARHKLRLHDRSLDEMMPDIVDAAKAGTVLVVCNRIEQAKGIFDAIRKKISSVELLHGGFTVRDRQAKEKKLFKREGHWAPSCRVLVATQVVEVSLNISFDTIFTEIAPVNELLQRFGRVNRFYELKRPADVHVATRFDEKKVGYIYEPERLKLTLETAPNGELLTPPVESKWVHSAYAGGYLKKEQEEYDRARESFWQVVNNLRPFYNSTCEDEFYDLFDSISVLPAELLSVYTKAHVEKRYLQAAELLMSLPMSTFWRFQNEDAIQKVPLPNEDGGYVLVVKRHYDPDIGLTNEPATLPPAGMEDEL